MSKQESVAVTWDEGMVLDIRLLPPELRLMIYWCVLNDWDEYSGKTPNLVKALRAAPFLYHEVLEKYYERGVFTVSYDNRVSQWGMSRKAYSAIKKLKLGKDRQD